jgi:hypothetical protein
MIAVVDPPVDYVPFVKSHNWFRAVMGDGLVHPSIADHDSIPGHCSGVVIEDTGDIISGPLEQRGDIVGYTIDNHGVTVGVCQGNPLPICLSWESLTVVDVEAAKFILESRITCD